MPYYCPQITVNGPAVDKNRNSLADFSPYNMLYITVSSPLSICLLCMQVMQLLRRVISQVAIVELGWQQIVWILMCIPMYCLPKERGRRVLRMCVHQPGVGVTAFQSKPLNNSNRMLNVAPQVKKSGQSFTLHPTTAWRGGMDSSSSIGHRIAHAISTLVISAGRQGPQWSRARRRRREGGREWV